MLHAMLTLVNAQRDRGADTERAVREEKCSDLEEFHCFNNVNYNTECEAYQALVGKKLEFTQREPEILIRKGKCDKCSTEPAPVCVDHVTYSNECERKEAERRAHVEWVKANEDRAQPVAWQPSSVSWGACKKFQKLRDPVEVCKSDLTDSEEMTLEKCAFTCQAAEATTFLYPRFSATNSKCVCQSLQSLNRTTCSEEEKNTFHPV